MRIIRLAVPFVVLVVALAGVGVGAPAQAAQWQSQDGGWTGTGAAFLPGGTFVGGSNPNSADCPGCSWEVRPVCELTGERNCQTDFGCPAGQRFALIKVNDPSIGMTVTVGSECLRPGSPIPVSDIGSWVADSVRQAAPSLIPGFVPRNETLTMLPSIFWTGQQRHLQRNDSLSGLSVAMEADANWSWTWGDGTRSYTTTNPGGPWPNRSVTHVYTRSGKVSVTVIARWEARFWVNGHGPFTVLGEPITQSETLTVPVRQARAVLIQ